MRAFARGWAIAAACGLLAGRSARAGDLYQGLPFAPYEVYEAMLQFAAEGNFTHLEKAMRYARPLVRALGRGACGEDLEGALDGAVARRDAPAAREAVHKLVTADLHRQLEAAVAAGPGPAREEPLQAAFTFYLLLAPEIAARQRPVDEQVRAAFHELRSAAAGAPLAARIGALVDAGVPHCQGPARRQP